MINIFKRKSLFLFAFSILFFIVGCTNSFVVTFKDYDDSVIEVLQVKKGDTITPPTNPTREGYIFKSWDSDFTLIETNVDVKATYEIKTYNVSFKYEDNTIINVVLVEHGKDALAPIIDVDEGFTFYWDSDFTNVTQDLEIKAILNLNTYLVRFFDYDDSLLKEEIVSHGLSATPPNNPVRLNYDFLGWDNDFNLVNKNLDVKAKYDIKVYHVVFKHHDDTLIKTALVEHGKDAIAPIVDVDEGFLHFWDKKYTDVTQDLIVKGVLKLKTYQVRFLDFDNHVIKEETVGHGFDATTPNDPVRYNYDFLNWDIDYNNVKSNLDVKAIYSVEKMSVLFMNEQHVFHAASVHVGAKVDMPLTLPTKEGMVFDSWLVKGTNVAYDFNNLVTDSFILEAKFIDKTVDYEYSLDSGKIRLDKYIGSDVDIIIPEFINNIPVGIINNSAFEGLPIETVYIHKGITQIKFFAFRDTAELRSVIFEEGSQVTVISQYLFKNSVKLESINIPASVLIIDQGAFENTPLLTTVTFEPNGQLKEIVKYAFYKSGVTHIELPETLEKIGLWAFAENPNLETVELGQNNVLETIGSNAFDNATSLTSFKLPSTVKKIGGMAFNNNIALTTFTIEPGSLLEVIGQHAFFEAKYLTSIFIPKGVLVLETQVFIGATRLTTVVFEENSSLTKIGISAFSKTGISEIVIPKTVTIIDNGAFYNSKLATITFEQGSVLKTINRNAFQNTYIKNFLLPKSVTTLGTDLFLENSSLERFYIEPGSLLTNLPGGMFGNNNSLLVVVIPSSVETISNRVALGRLVNPTFYLETSAPKPGFESGWSQQNVIHWGDQWHYVDDYKPILNP